MSVCKKRENVEDAVIWFAPFANGTSKFDRMRDVLNRVEMKRTVSEGDLVAVKLHFGEEGNDTYLRPEYARLIVDAVKEAGGKPFLCDSTTLYTGCRRNAVDHLNLAVRHGFGPEVTGAPVVIADGLKSNDWRPVAVAGKHFSEVKIAGSIADADSMVVLSHFKGHVRAGFGGAVKNLAMGCACALGKKDQHAANLSVAPEECIACGRCARNCPVRAISMKNPAGANKAFIDQSKCIGCSECMTHCPVSAISIDWGSEEDRSAFGERMAEYALGAVRDKRRVVYVNVMTDITPLCDCCGWSDNAIVPPIGIAASIDPVALDKFCLDKVTEAVGSALPSGCEKFSHIHPKTEPESQLNHGQAIGLGKLSAQVEVI
ncbi:DUF362 domain-containing protein [Jonquetella sp. BV3C21]|uniref:DUF362 domain-containing protein n=1 Tax=Jonquetella sp. BV3C21 TaxID=1111126 RepID=UPI0003AE7CE7|nr:DUF362 domain-containing protein [Jonquetella sp. BV3C21]ERL24542.1 PF04015 domain protein [Jonquetella sp. BV3C21]